MNRKVDKLREKVSISLPPEMLEVIDSYCEFHSMSRSSAIGYLLARSLCHESYTTEGFDFNSPYIVEQLEDGTEYVLRRADVKTRDPKSSGYTGWVFSMMNKSKQVVIVHEEDFKVNPDKPAKYDLPADDE